MSHVPSTGFPPVRLRALNVFSIKDYGAVGDGTTDDTEAIQAAIDAAGAARGTVYIPPVLVSYAFTNLTLPPYMRLAGAHMQRSRLERIAGSTGIAIREKTVAEGNDDGATGIWLTDFQVDGNDTVGDGINLGNQNGLLNFETFAGIENVSVQRFVGTGMKICSNSSLFKYLWVKECTIGVELSGAGGVANIIHGLFSEVNTSKALVVDSQGTHIYGIHIEDKENGATGPLIEVTQNDCLLSGVFVSLAANTGHVIDNTGTRNRYQHVTIFQNGFTWTHGIYDTVLGAGTGAVVSRIADYVSSETSSIASFWVNQDTGETNSVVDDTTTLSGLEVTNDVRMSGQLGIGAAASDPWLINVRDSTTKDKLLIYHAGGNGTYTAGGDFIAARCDDGTTVYDLLDLSVLNNPGRSLRFTSDGELIVGGRIQAGGSLTLADERAPAQITSNQDNYNPTGMSSASLLYLTSDASRDITGFAGGAVGRRLWVYNGGAQNIVLKHKVTSTAANQICGRGNADTTLTPGTGVHLIYSAEAGNFWLVATDAL